MPQKSGSRELTNVYLDRDANIREIFLAPSKRYSYAEAERLTGIPAGSMRVAIRRVPKSVAPPGG